MLHSHFLPLTRSRAGTNQCNPDSVLDCLRKAYCHKQLILKDKENNNFLVHTL
uniref:Uncharacterized protein n=1 Tax=uncultured bacterium B19D1_C12D4_E9D6 TaxID=1329637 RepID=S4W353_9BACT|nr:hypothetical protein [uncultured bacterium B19D1_C12D4_E9D6]